MAYVFDVASRRMQPYLHVRLATGDLRVGLSRMPRNLPLILREFTESTLTFVAVRKHLSCHLDFCTHIKFLPSPCWQCRRVQGHSHRDK